MTTARTQQFEHIRETYREHLILTDVDSDFLEGLGHSLCVWDAIRMPTRGHYEPVFVDLIEELERSGKISPETTVLLETTTGNAGVAAADVAIALGYDIQIFIPEDMPKPRIEDIQRRLDSAKSRNSKLIYTPAGQYVKGMVEYFGRYLAKARHEDVGGKSVFALNHSRSLIAVRSFYKIGHSLFSEGKAPDVAILALGNGTTVSGFARALLECNPQAKIVAVEPIEAPCFQAKRLGKTEFAKIHGVDPKFRRHNLIGMGGWGVDFPNCDLSLIHHFDTVAEGEWRHGSDEFELSEQVGHSSNACLTVVKRWAEKYGDDPRRFFTIFYDPAWKY